MLTTEGIDGDGEVWERKIFGHLVGFVVCPDSHLIIFGPGLFSETRVLWLWLWLGKRYVIFKRRECNNYEFSFQRMVETGRNIIGLYRCGGIGAVVLFLSTTECHSLFLYFVCVCFISSALPMRTITIFSQTHTYALRQVSFLNVVESLVFIINAFGAELT